MVLLLGRESCPSPPRKETASPSQRQRGNAAGGAARAGGDWLRMNVNISSLRGPMSELEEEVTCTTLCLVVLNVLAAKGSCEGGCGSRVGWACKFDVDPLLTKRSGDMHRPRQIVDGEAAIRLS